MRGETRASSPRKSSEWNIQTFCKTLECSRRSRRRTCWARTRNFRKKASRNILRRRNNMGAKKPNAYALAGVDVDVEAEASRIMYEASKKTFENRGGKSNVIVTPFDDFAGLKMVDISKLPEGSFMSLGFDGAGTKVEIAERVGRYDTIAFDLFAMVCDDALIRGGESIVVGSNLDIKTLGTDDRFLPVMRELGEGYVAAAKEANVAVINGEIAQMGSLMTGYGDFPFHWGAACIWVAKKENILTGTEMQVGDTVVMLREDGFRANGWCLVRKI